MKMSEKNKKNPKYSYYDKRKKIWIIRRKKKKVKYENSLFSPFNLKYKKLPRKWRPTHQGTCR